MSTATAQPRPQPLDRWDAALVGLVCVGWIALRWGQLDRGFTSDEISLLFSGSFEQLLADVQTSVNPPWLRALLSSVEDRREGLMLGRWLSLLGGLTAIPSIYAMARRLSGLRIVALLAVGVVLVQPLSIEVTSMARVYGLWLGVAAGTLLCATEWVERPRWTVGFGLAVGALVLPQLHFFSVPLVLILGIGVAALSGRPVMSLALHLPAALAFVPWLSAVLGGADDRIQPPQGGWWDALNRVAGPWGPREATWLLVVLAGLCVVLATGRRAHKLMAVAVVGLVASTWLLGRQHMFTPHAVVFGLAVLPAAVAAAAGQRIGEPESSPVRLLGIAARVGAGLWLAQVLVAQVSDLDRASELRSRDAIRTFSQSWRVWVAAGAEVRVEPAYEMQTVLFEVRGELLGELRTQAACRQERRCFEADGTRFVGGTLDQTPRDREVVWLHTNRNPPDTLPPGCTIDTPEPHVRLVRCPRL